ncbi:MAG: aldehyde dehydrogenase family protein, partial [Alphaproteobacteria bacterium]
EEIFGPVLSILKYKDLEDAIRIGNDTLYGLAGYVQSADHSKGQAVAKRIRAGHINVNQAGSDFNAPFGGYKHSGNGREWGSVGFEEFLEVKTILGYNKAA